MARRLAPLLLVAALLAPVPAGAATTYVVTTTDDDDDRPCTEEHCSLAVALRAANAAPGADVIAFDIPGAGPHRISLTRPLPAITDAVTIDGSTQPGFEGLPVIEIDGSLLNEPGVYGDGVRIEASSTTIEHLAINDFVGGAGIVIVSPTTVPLADVVVRANFIGTDPTGTVAEPNFFGLGLGPGSGVLVGGPDDADRNVISGNYAGIHAGPGDSGGARIQGNFIGTDVTGEHALGNESDGIRIDGSDFLVGGPDAGNVISGNATGLVFATQPAHDNVVQGNLIGPSATGKPLGNEYGVHFVFEASDNVVGGEGPAANVISSNRRGGILVQSGRANRLTRNSIHSNGGPAIDLGSNPPVTPNDPGDTDAGPNARQNFPALEAATAATVEGYLDSAPNETYAVEVFATAECDASGFGEAEEFAGATSVTTDRRGRGEFSVELPPLAGRFLTATATDRAGNTSELSRCLDRLGPGPPQRTLCRWFTATPGDRPRSGARLESVALAPDGDGWAVGSIPARAGGTKTLAQRWDGVSWGVVPTPFTRGQANVLLDVAVGANGDAWAVGKRSGRAVRTVAQHYDGGAWRATATPNPSPSWSALEGVDVAPDGTVWAVGSRRTQDSRRPLVLQRAGGPWQVAPGVSGEGALHDVAALAGDDVWAVGQMVEDGRSLARILHFDGDAWTETAAPSPGPRFNVLRSVSAVAPDDVWATGSYRDAGVLRPLTLHFDGTQWTTEPQPQTNGDVALLDLSASTQHVVAVGERAGDEDARVIYESDRSGWAEAVLDEDGTGAHLRGVDLGTGGDAWTVGFRNARSHVERRMCS